MILKKSSLLLITILVFIIVFMVLKQLSFNYESYVKKSYYKNIENQLNSKSLILKEVINSRFALLQGVSAYTTTNLHINPHFFDTNNQQALDFLKALYEHNTCIRNISIAKNGVQSLMYPINEKVLGHDLLADKRQNVVENIEKAIRTGEPILDGPYELRQGGLGIILRLAIHNEDNFWGLITMVLDLPELFSEANISTLNSEYSIVALDINKKPVFGSIPEGESEPISIRVELFDKHIYLLAYPANNQHINNLPYLINGIILIISFLLSYVVYILLSRDIYLKKEIEKALFEVERKEEILIAQSRHAAMGEMISMIAHQWRQPLTAIGMDANKILLDIALEEFTSAEAEKYAMSIAEKIQYLSSTIDDFRNFFKPDKVIKDVNLREVLADTLTIVKESLINNNIALTTSFETDKKVKAYPRELMQVFISIINNSIDVLKLKKPDMGSITIRVYEDKKYINTVLCDNGGGISDDILSKVFDPYFSTKDEKTGTGLGLYISKMIIENHLNGIIEVQNSSEGACFTIRLLKEQIEN